MSDKKFLQDVLRISIPVALQSMLQSTEKQRKRASVSIFW